MGIITSMALFLGQSCLQKGKLLFLLGSIFPLRISTQAVNLFTLAGHHPSLISDFTAKEFTLTHAIQNLSGKDRNFTVATHYIYSSVCNSSPIDGSFTT